MYLQLGPVVGTSTVYPMQSSAIVYIVDMSKVNVTKYAVDTRFCLRVDITKLVWYSIFIFQRQYRVKYIYIL